MGAIAEEMTADTDAQLLHFRGKEYCFCRKCLQQLTLLLTTEHPGASVSLDPATGEVEVSLPALPNAPWEGEPGQPVAVGR